MPIAALGAEMLGPTRMRLLFFRTADNAMVSGLHAEILDRLPQLQVETYGSLEPLRTRLLLPRRTSALVVLLAPASQAELQHLTTLRTLLDDVRLLLVLPDQSPETVSLGHLFLPSFVTFREGVACVVPVLEKMIGLNQSENLGARQ